MDGENRLLAPLKVAEGWLRVGVGLLWTTVLGIPLLAFIYSRYVVGLVCSVFGRPDLLDGAVDRNVQTFEMVSRDYWARGIFVITRMSFCAREETHIEWKRTHVICANHTSVFDIFALMSAVPVPVRFVAKQELEKWPIIGWSLRPSGQVLVNRADRAEAIRSISEAALSDVRGQIIFFVEGTRSPDGSLLPFKKGAFHFALANQLPLLPTAIGGAHTALSRRAWWKLNPGSEIQVDFCRPIEVPHAWDEKDRAHLIEHLREQTRHAISEALDRSEAERRAA